VEVVELVELVVGGCEELVVSGVGVSVDDSSVDVEADVLLASELEPDPAVPDGSLPETGR